MQTTAVVAALISCALLGARPARAETTPTGHGPGAPGDQFPSHRFQLAPHEPPGVQLAFNYGLLQPLVLHGFNAAVEVRYRRLVATYSHGQGLDFTRFDTADEKAAGATVRVPWSTGGGVGVLLIDELWILADFKVHRFSVDTAADHAAYTVVTVGAELGWRFFLWKGLNVALVARYWPNVYSTAGKGVTLHRPTGEAFIDPPAQQGYSGLFANVLVGWAFDL